MIPWFYLKPKERETETERERLHKFKKVVNIGYIRRGMRKNFHFILQQHLSFFVFYNVPAFLL